MVKRSFLKMVHLFIQKTLTECVSKERGLGRKLWWSLEKLWWSLEKGSVEKIPARGQQDPTADSLWV